MPDSYILIAGSANWVELKAPIEPIREGSILMAGNHKLSIAQQNWLLTHRQAGGRGWVAIETERWVLLVGARHCTEINNLSLKALRLLADFGIPRPVKPEGWAHFESTLCNKNLIP